MVLSFLRGSILETSILLLFHNTKIRITVLKYHDPYVFFAVFGVQNSFFFPK